MDTVSSKRKKLPYIDVLKGLAILLVVLSHTRFPWVRLHFSYWGNVSIPLFITLTSFLMTNSFERYKPWESVSSFERYAVQKLKRYLTPAVYAYALMMVFIVLKGNTIQLWKQFITGFGIGAGTYYVPILIQIIFLLPVVYVVIKHYDKTGVYGFLVLHIGYEFFAKMQSMTPLMYRVNGFRYLFIYALGCYIALNMEKKYFGFSVYELFSFLTIGMSYITFISTYRTTQTIFPMELYAYVNVYACLYFAVLIILLFKIVPKLPEIRIISLIGQASYHIMFVQMVYFGFSNYIISSSINSRLSNSIFAMVLGVLVETVVNVAVGLLFYIAEPKLSRMIASLFQRK